MEKDVFYPRHLVEAGIAAAKRGCERPWNVGAGDTETVRGEPYSLQLCLDGETPEVFDVSPETILGTMVERLDDWAVRGMENYCFFHNFKFDLQALLWHPRYRELFLTPTEQFVLPLEHRKRRGMLLESSTKTNDEETRDAEKYRVWLDCYVGKNWFAKLHLKNHRMVWLVDSFAFFKGSLKRAAAMVRAPAGKLDPPRDPRCEDRDPGGKDGTHVAGGCRCLGEANLLGDPGFEAYRRQDVIAQWHVGKAIAGLHREYDVAGCVSLPHMASRVFKRKFVPVAEPIPFPPTRVSKVAELAYHGGLNFMTVPPGWYKDCWEVDINSAYAWAMTQLPVTSVGEWREVDGLPPPGSWGFLLVSGETNCRYGIVHAHDFSKLKGRFENVWTTTIEVEQGLKWGCLRIARARGYVWEPGEGSLPFRDYALHWAAEKKRHSEDEGLPYQMPKLFNNSLYGKAIQTTRFMKNLLVDARGRPQVSDLWRAGGIYNAPIAAWITAKVRADRLHEAAHASEGDVGGRWFPALHGSTDSIKTLRDPASYLELGDELGQWSVKVKGRCLLLRTKVYVHEDERDPSRPKAAYHGFWRKDFRLLLDASGAILKGQDYRYFAKHVNQTKESLKRTKKKLVPLMFTREPRWLKAWGDAPKSVPSPLSRLSGGLLPERRPLGCSPS